MPRKGLNQKTVTARGVFFDITGNNPVLSLHHTIITRSNPSVTAATVFDCFRHCFRVFAHCFREEEERAAASANDSKPLHERGRDVTYQVHV